MDEPRTPPVNAQDDLRDEVERLRRQVQRCERASQHFDGRAAAGILALAMSYKARLAQIEVSGEGDEASPG